MQTVDARRPLGHSRVVSDEENTDEWLARICDLNETSGSAWAARFEIAGPSLVATAARELALIGATLTPNGPHQQYLVKFPVHTARDVVRIVAAQDGALCRRQSTLIEETAQTLPVRRCAAPLSSAVLEERLQKAR
jgi:hypothetical protein